MLLAIDIAGDAFTLTTGRILNVLSNDTDGTSLQNVSSVNFDYDPATASGETDWLIPVRPGSDPAIPQRSLIPGSLVEEPDQLNRGDIDLWLDAGGTYDNVADDVPMTRVDGMVISTIRENTVPASGASSTNLSVIGFNTQGGDTANVWLSMVGGPQNIGENNARLGAALFPYSASWRGMALENDLTNYAPSGVGITVTRIGTGRYEVTVEGVNDSQTDGYLFTMCAGNGDNYTQSMPMGGNKWLVARRDNAANFAGGEDGTWNLLYIPRGAQGLIAGHVNGDSIVPNPLYHDAGGAIIRRESSGFWRLSIPGHSPTSGALLLESNDIGRGAPSNVYLSYQADGNDFIIRQLEGNTMNPINDDFQFVFVPFENQLLSVNTLSVTSLSDTGSPGNANVSDLGIPLVLNADGTILYQLSDQARVLGDGQIANDYFQYIATDGIESSTATVTVTWLGANDPPDVLDVPENLVFDEDDAPVLIDLTTIFADIDQGDELTYTFNPGLGGIVQMSIAGTSVSVGPAPDRFGMTTVSVTATDLAGASSSVQFVVTIFPQSDSVVAVDDAAVTDKETPVTIVSLANDYHPDTTPFSVASSSIFGNSEATGDSDTTWAMVQSTLAPNEMTIIGTPNRGDVAIGRGGAPLTLVDGVMLGTIRDEQFPFGTVNTYQGSSGITFATELGAGGNGERNAQLYAGFFPFAEAWTGGHVDSSGRVVGGVGITPESVTVIRPGLYEVTIPEVTSAANDGLLFVIGGNNDDNIMSVAPAETGNSWLVRQMDNDGLVDAFEVDPWSFVYIPGDVAGLIGGRFGGSGGFFGNRQLLQQYGPVSVAENANGSLTLSIEGYTPADGALLAISSGSTTLIVDDAPLRAPLHHNVVVSATGNDFLIDALESETFANAPAEVQFIFLPYASPVERFDGLGFSISSFSSTSALGAAVTLSQDGTFVYDPTQAGAPISELGNGESLVDTFTYTIVDGRGGTSTATVTVTVQGENQPPTANDDVINLNEIAAKGALLTVLRNDTDPDLESVLGTTQGTVAANLAVDSEGVWSVAGSGSGDHAITLGSTALGDVEILRNGSPIVQSEGIVVASIRENFSGAAVNYRLVQAYANASGGTSLALQQFGTDGAANAPLSLAYFPFADRWVGAHVDSAGGLLSGNGIAAGNITKTGTGRYRITIPGVTSAERDGFIFAIGNQNADNVVSTRAVPGTGDYEVAVRDNTQDFAAGEDGGFSFLFIPRNAENLVAGVVDSGSAALNPLSLAVGQFTLQRQDVAEGGFEWKLTIPGQSPESGVLLLTNQDNTELEDNFLSYQSDGAGSFLIRGYDLPGVTLQAQPFTFAFIPFENPGRPVARPIPDLLTITDVSATSNLGAALSINADGTISYQPGTLFDSLYSDESVSDTFTYTISDGFGGSDTASVTVNIQGFGDAPVIVASSGATRYGLGDSPIGIDRLADLLEIGTPNLDGAVLTLAITDGALPTDLLGIRNEGSGPAQIGISGTEVTFAGVTIGSFTGGENGNPLAITLSAAATGPAVDALLRALTFANFAAETPEGIRQLSMSIVDGRGRTSPAAVKNLNLSFLRSRTLQKGVDFGFGAYAGAKDVTIRQDTPSTAPSPTADLFVDWDGGAANTQVLLRFDDLFGNGPGQIPVGSLITSATLLLDTNPNTSNAQGDGATMHRMLRDWTETETWDSMEDGIQKDDFDARAFFDSQVGTATGEASTGTGTTSFSVLPDVRAWAEGAANYGWAMIGWNGNTDGWFFSSSENASAARRPRLEIEWLPASTFQAVSFQNGVGGYQGAKDTEVRDSEPDTNKALVDTLSVDAPPPNTQTLLRFDDIFGDGAGQIPLGSKIITARLTTASTTGNSQGHGGRFHVMLADWSDADTWNTLVGGVSADGVEAVSTWSAQAGNSTRTPLVQAGFHTWDVTLDLQSWSDGVYANKGWGLLPWTGGTDGWTIRSSEAAQIVERPRLEVYFTEATNSAPTDILLDGSSVAENSPTTGGLAIGQLSTVDPNAEDTHTYSLVAGEGDSDAFEIVGNLLRMKEGQTIDFETKPSYIVRVRSTDNGGLSVTKNLDIQVIDRGEIEAIVVGDGTNQRSRVEQVVVRFDSVVTIESEAFEVRKRGTGGGPVEVNASSTTVDGKTVVTLTFGGPFTQFGSLVDGNYELRIRGDQITDALNNAFDGDRNGTVGGDRVFGTVAADAFFRYYGDSTGDRSVVLAELIAFRATYGRGEGSAGFNPSFDFNDDGLIGLGDLTQFRSRYGRSLGFE